jgi:hypothetical protein
VVNSITTILSLLFSHNTSFMPPFTVGIWACRSLLFYLLIRIVIIFAPCHAQTDSISIYDQPAYKRQRGCLKHCYDCNGCALMDFLGCGNALFDSCFCRANLAFSASSFLTSCINTACSSAPSDLNSAVSIYNGYCHINGAILDNAVVTSTVADTTALAGEEVTATLAPLTRGGSPAAPTVVVVTAIYTGSIPGDTILYTYTSELV